MSETDNWGSNSRKDSDQIGPVHHNFPEIHFRTFSGRSMWLVFH